MREQKFIKLWLDSDSELETASAELTALMSDGWRIAYEQFVGQGFEYVARLERDVDDNPHRPRNADQSLDTPEAQEALNTLFASQPIFGVGERVGINDEDWPDGWVKKIEYSEAFKFYRYWVEDEKGAGCWIEQPNLHKLVIVPEPKFSVGDSCFIDDDDWTSGTIKQVDYETESNGYMYWVVDDYGDGHRVPENDLIKNRRSAS
jgi:hypothetical protein